MINGVYANAAELWVEAAKVVLRDGAERSPRGQKTKELLGAQLTLADPNARIPALPIRKFSTAYACGELAWYLAASSQLEFIQHYAPQYERFSDDGATLWGAYGPRLFELDSADGHHDELSPWQRCVKLLQRDPDTRQAVLPIYRSYDLGKSTKDLPCTLTLQFFLRDAKLRLIVNMRSNDLWLGLPYDLFCFTALQDLMAYQLGVEAGPYVHQAGSLHLYEKDWRGAERTIEAWDPRAPQPAPTSWVRTIEADVPLDSTAGFLALERIFRADGLQPTQDIFNKTLQRPNVERSLIGVAALAWAWKRAQGSPLVTEAQRRVLGELASAKLGPLFDRCFF